MRPSLPTPFSDPNNRKTLKLPQVYLLYYNILIHRVCVKLPCLTSKDEYNCNCRMSSNKALGYYDDHQASLVDWDWASPAIQAYSTANDLYKVRLPLYFLKKSLTFS